MADVARLRELAPDMSQAEAARATGVTREWIRQIANKHGIEFRDGRSRDPVFDAEIVSLADMMTVRQISEATGRCYENVCEILAKHGVKARRYQKPFKPFDASAAMKMRDRGASYAEIAKAQGVCTQTAWRRLTRLEAAA